MNTSSLSNAALILEDGNIFFGKQIGISGETFGEIVFNTSMTGYQEIITDPSYSNQIITFTYPHIGNVGVNKNDCESNIVYANGIIIRDLSIVSSNYRSEGSLLTYLKKKKIIGISDIDTRKLTKIIRISGSQLGCIIAHKKIKISKTLQKLKQLSHSKKIDLVQIVSTKTQYTLNNKNFKINNIPTIKNIKKKSKTRIVVYDFGVKQNILKILINQKCHITVVPAQTSAKEAMKLLPNGIFLSNGPGDPRPCYYAINAIKSFLKINIPIFGICLGHQLLALANGAQITKMRFGHHGGNHPVKELCSNKVMITSQNHNFTVNPIDLPKSIEITHISLFDKSIQGLRIKDKNAFSFQGHPESSPGPHDALSLFENFITLVKSCNYNIANKGEKCQNVPI
ncbi:carbamoyl phosphate synthase small subunit [Buchnera aphidicola (Schlechtendalia chinensis)]|uniref:Carbamoyl phosphate synthase small chain n=1 Tax=Buchnera aphidicola subsp. Schlechtendalia chinensis TaxID=118110 RepID=A0A172WE88_BUCSC|nr:glutamine-hydrolyzing carbamoyl-phosphate synthase small subunit [Buchnera aphidicola]ANF17296.1 carbamoyl phosphate synthase small subunit [Buchnera aphidicola (Schlechtendalia chinensis)]